MTAFALTEATASTKRSSAPSRHRPCLRSGSAVGRQLPPMTLRANEQSPCLPPDLCSQSLRAKCVQREQSPTTTPCSFARNTMATGKGLTGDDLLRPVALNETGLVWSLGSTCGATTVTSSLPQACTHQVGNTNGQRRRMFHWLSRRHGCWKCWAVAEATARALKAVPTASCSRFNQRPKTLPPIPALAKDNETPRSAN